MTPLSIEAALQASGFVADQLAELNDGAEPSSLPALPGDLEQFAETTPIAGKADSAPAKPARRRTGASARTSAPPLPRRPPVGRAPPPPHRPMAWDWEGMYEAVMPPGSYTRSAAPPAAVAAAPAAAGASAGSQAGRR